MLKYGSWVTSGTAGGRTWDRQLTVNTTIIPIMPGNL
jgi:hypothetical protein